MENPQLLLAHEFVNYTNENIFLTGKAGTGKTTFLHNIKKSCLKRMVVVAPTGVAAINAGGVTIHSFFQLSFGIQLQAHSETKDNQYYNRFSKKKINIIRSIDLLIIDEISMVRADLLDGIDEVLRRIRRNQNPFGGVQLLMIGDLHQLPPVIKNDEWEILKTIYSTGFFFSSKALQNTKFVSIELTHIFRQSDAKFIELLSKIRENNLDNSGLSEINRRFIPNYKPEDGTIILTTHNNQAYSINESRLKELSGKSYRFLAEIEGEFPEYSYPVDFELILKTGAQVMFVKNDSSQEKRYYNGKIGRVTELSQQNIVVRCPDDTEDIYVGYEEWENIKYEIDDETKEIKESVIGKFFHYPLKLAWAITIHKSQGLTFDKAVVDAKAAFAFGQVYVAFSRCRTMEGLILSSQIGSHCIKSDQNVTEFTEHADRINPGIDFLEQSKKKYQWELLFELFSFTYIQKKLSYFLKVLRENKGSINTETIRWYEQVSDQLKTELADVSDRFQIQLKSLIEKSDSSGGGQILQERLSKAGMYFFEKFSEILEDKIVAKRIPTDNKELKKTIGTLIGQIGEEVHLKKICFKSCETGFDLHRFLSDRAKASIEEISLQKAKKDVDVIVEKNYNLYKLLKAWRDRKARESGLVSYRIIREPVLVQLAELTPVTLRELNLVKKFGNQKKKDYGAEIISIIRDYLKSEGTDISDKKNDVMADSGLKLKKGQTFKISYDMFRSGKNINEIANERGYALSTIEGHLARFISSGEIALNEMMENDKIEKITAYFKKTNDYSLSNAKHELEDKFTYSELRFVMCHLTGKNTGKDN